MGSDTFWTAIGSICAFCTIAWSVFTFIIQIQFKSHREETKNFHSQLSEDIEEIKTDVKFISNDMVNIKTSVAVNSEKINQLESNPGCKNYSAKKIKSVIYPKRRAL